MKKYLEQLRAKPGHVRERIAYGSAAGVSALVAIAWFAVVTTSGTFALAPANDASGNAQVSQTIADAKTGFASLLGAAASFNADAPVSGVVIVTSTTTPASGGTPTVLPF